MKRLTYKTLLLIALCLLGLITSCNNRSPLILPPLSNDKEQAEEVPNIIDLSAVQEEKQIKFSWAYPTIGNISGYEIYIKGQETPLYKSDNTDSTSWTFDASNKPNGIYTFTFYATDMKGNKSSGISFAFDYKEPELELPNIKDLTAIQKGTKIIFSWSLPTSNEINGYEFYIEGVASAIYSSSAVETTSWTYDTENPNDGTYEFTFFTTDKNGNKSSGLIYSFDYHQQKNLPDVTNFKVEQQKYEQGEDVYDNDPLTWMDYSVTLSWSAPVSSDVTGYDIYIGDTLIKEIKDPSVESYTYVGMQNNSDGDYTFKIYTVDDYVSISQGSEYTIHYDRTPPRDFLDTEISITLNYTPSSSPAYYPDAELEIISNNKDIKYIRITYDDSWTDSVIMHEFVNGTHKMRYSGGAPNINLLIQTFDEYGNISTGVSRYIPREPLE